MGQYLDLDLDLDPPLAVPEHIEQHTTHTLRQLGQPRASFSPKADGPVTPGLIQPQSRWPCDPRPHSAPKPTAP